MRNLFVFVVITWHKYTIKLKLEKFFFLFQLDSHSNPFTPQQHLHFECECCAVLYQLYPSKEQTRHVFIIRVEWNVELYSSHHSFPISISAVMSLPFDFRMWMCGISGFLSLYATRHIFADKYKFRLELNMCGFPYGMEKFLKVVRGIGFCGCWVWLLLERDFIDLSFLGGGHQRD